MCANKFLIGGLIGVHVSSIVNEGTKTNSSQFNFFLLKKSLNAQKRKSSQYQPTKQKQANTKQ